MPAKSKSQQRLFGAVHACQKKGKCASPEIKKIAGTIKSKDAEDFARTKHKGLPEKKDENKLSFSGLWNKIIAEKNENRDLNEDMNMRMSNWRTLPFEIDGSPVYVSNDNQNLAHDGAIIGNVQVTGPRQNPTVNVTRNYEQYRNGLQTAFNNFITNPHMHPGRSMSADVSKYGAYGQSY